MLLKNTYNNISHQRYVNLNRNKRLIISLVNHGNRIQNYNLLIIVLVADGGWPPAANFILVVSDILQDVNNYAYNYFAMIGHAQYAHETDEGKIYEVKPCKFYRRFLMQATFIGYVLAKLSKFVQISTLTYSDSV